MAQIYTAQWHSTELGLKAVRIKSGFKILHFVYRVAIILTSFHDDKEDTQTYLQETGCSFQNSFSRPTAQSSKAKMQLCRTQMKFHSTLHTHSFKHVL